MINQLRPAIIILLLLTVLTGLVYPLVVTGLAQVIFPYQANGSLIVANGKTVGSEHIGQPFDDPKYFWGRLSATAPYAYNAAASTGSNLGPTNPALVDASEARVQALKDANAAAGVANDALIPVDLATASGSGLDPDISVAAAQYQAPRVAKLRGLSLEQVQALISQNTTGRFLGFIGEPSVNVLKLNLALDGLK
jgi:potassium-transporting ATPase KdpC subunit